MAALTARLTCRWENTFYFVGIFILQLSHCILGGCGPLGYDVKDLLSPDYWFFDMTKEICDTLPWNGKMNRTKLDANATECRMYMNLCRGMTYQCSGSVCLRYLNTPDYVVLLGKAMSDPFHEVGEAKGFYTTFSGEELCSGKVIETTISFKCEQNKTWDTKIVHYHNGAKAPQPKAMTFDRDNCKLNLLFDYSGACVSTNPADAPGKHISIGSIVLILFFPGLLLYFIVGMLINKMAGRRGKDLIPHSAFWLDLPDLIMDGFIFSMAMLTCRKSEPKMNYEHM